MNKKGFTLIELLVVVLIIGILSSVALPQYTKAVEKSRLAGVWSTLGSLRKATNVYFLENPEHEQVEDMKSLDAELNYTYSGNYCSASLCQVQCPSNGWTNCWYFAEAWIRGSSNNPAAIFGFKKNGTATEVWIDNSGQHCAGTLCSQFGISSEGSTYYHH